MDGALISHPEGAPFLACLVEWCQKDPSPQYVDEFLIAWSNQYHTEVDSVHKLFNFACEFLFRDSKKSQRKKMIERVMHCLPRITNPLHFINLFEFVLDATHNDAILEKLTRILGMQEIGLKLAFECVRCLLLKKDLEVFLINPLLYNLMVRMSLDKRPFYTSRFSQLLSRKSPEKSTDLSDFVQNHAELLRVLLLHPIWLDQTKEAFSSRNRGAISPQQLLNHYKCPLGALQERLLPLLKITQGHELVRVWKEAFIIEQKGCNLSNGRGHHGYQIDKAYRKDLEEIITYLGELEEEEKEKVPYISP